jgi:mannan endo-1,4-beta-mannosidase
LSREFKEKFLGKTENAFIENYNIPDTSLISPMTTNRFFLFYGVLNLLLFIPIYGQNVKHPPVSPDASCEATALLDFLYEISGKYTLTGQHSYPNTKGTNYKFAAEYIGKTPVIYSTDMGFAKDGDTDSYLARPDIVKKAIELYRLGVITTFCWHAVPPTTVEPVTFRPVVSSRPDSLISVQGQLLDDQFKDLLTPGTILYQNWCTQVDSVAFYLKKLQEAQIPVLWRPYHEMNGSWFWWGGRIGEYSTVRLYKQLFDRLVNFHKLNNLIWVWNIDRPHKEAMKFTNYFPGNEYVDIVSIDIYGNDFKKNYYDSLVILSNGKPMAFGEVGNPPSPELLKTQPNWCYYATWAGMVRNTPRVKYDEILNDSRFLSMEDPDYISMMNPYRRRCNLPMISETKKTDSDFTGIWYINEGKSQLENSGAANLPYRLEIVNVGDSLKIEKEVILEYIKNQITQQLWIADGREILSEYWNSPMKSIATWSEDKDTLLINSKVIFREGNQKREFLTKERWYLDSYGRELLIKQTSDSPWGKKEILMVFDKHKFL